MRISTESQGIAAAATVNRREKIKQKQQIHVVMFNNVLLHYYALFI